MKNVENIVLPDEVPEADAIEQRLGIDPEDDAGLDTTQVDALGDRDANEADVIEQAIIVAVPDDGQDPM